LLRFVGEDGSLRSAIQLHNHSGKTPAHWSVEPGPYQIKTAIAILLAPECWVEEPLVSSARKTIQQWRGSIESHPPGDLHPLLYSLEGLLLYGLARHDASACQTAARAYRRLLEWQEPDGGLPASVSGHNGHRRSDVI